MAYELYLPQEQESAERAIQTLLTEGRQNRNVEAVRWWVNYYYMKGIRDFTLMDYRNGTVSFEYSNTTSQGAGAFRYGGVNQQFQSQLGRFLQMDISPKVVRAGIGLDGLRKSSIAQVALNEGMPQQKCRKLKIDLFPPLLRYGTVGIVNWASDEEIGIEVVPPWELLPIPAHVAEPSEARGIIRCRKDVPLEWIQAIPGMPGKRSEVWTQIESRRVQIGSASGATVSSLNTFQGPVQIPTFGKTEGGTQKAGKTEMVVAEFVEVWLKDSRGYLLEYVVVVGGKIMKRESYAEAKVHMPINVCRHTPVGGFWGESFVGPLIPVNMEVEEMLLRTFQGVKDWDDMGTVLLPTTMGIPPQFDRTEDGIRVIRYEPDPVTPNVAPGQLRPTRNGEAPVRIVGMALQLLDKLSGQPTQMMQGQSPGRVDSQVALGFLNEMAAVPLGPVAVSISEALSGNYRSMLGLMRMMWVKERVVAITMLDDTLAGIEMNPETGEVTLESSLIPHPDEVQVTIASEIPRSTEQRKIELDNALKLQAITMTEYRIMARKEGLDLPVGNEEEWQNYRRAVLENIILFGDGLESGKVTITEMDMHSVHLMVLRAFIARPEFMLASSAVRRAYYEHLDAHMAGMGVLPAGAPTPEEAAELADAGGMAGMAGMGGAGGMPAGMEGMGGQGGIPPELMAQLAAGMAEAGAEAGAGVGGGMGGEAGDEQETM